MSLKFHFKLHCCISLKKLCSGLFCKGKTLYSNLFDLINGVYSNPFRMFHLQPIWLTIRYSKFILFVSQAVPAVNWYSDALKCLHCHCQAFSSVTISQLQQQNIQRWPETAATAVWEIKELRLLYPPTGLHGVKIKKNAKWTLKQGNNAKWPGCCHRILKKYFIIT